MSEPTGLREYSVVYSDRALNHMSAAFGDVMRDIRATLTALYDADAVAVVPGSGTFGMEAVARQLAGDARCLILRNGWFSYRWTQILDAGAIASETTVMTARPVHDGPRAPFAPAPIDEVVAAIAAGEPDIVFAPQVETASGMLLPDDYVRAVGEATRAVGGLFVLDSIAAGALWIEMEPANIDVLISAPQKGWTGTPCCALCMLGPRARERVHQGTSSSFACDLGAWLRIMEAYQAGGHAYHATMPTDGLRTLRDVMQETQAFDFERARERQRALGQQVRALLAAHDLPSVAAEGFEAPSVVVSYTDDPAIPAAFARAGIQVAGGVPLRCGEGEDFQTFRIGLFGLDKLADVDGTVAALGAALDEIRA